MASKLGAKDVYLYETAEVAGVAAKVLKANRALNCHLISVPLDRDAGPAPR